MKAPFGGEFDKAKNFGLPESWLSFAEQKSHTLEPPTSGKLVQVSSYRGLNTTHRHAEKGVGKFPKPCLHYVFLAEHKGW